MEPPTIDPYEVSREAVGPEGQRQEHSTKDTYDSLQQFLHHDRKVLRYFAHSETPFTPLGKTYKKKYIICFFLSDNSLEVSSNPKKLFTVFVCQVRDVRDNSESKGAGTFPKFLKRQRLPKVRYCSQREFIHFTFVFFRSSNADSFPSMRAATQQVF